MALEIEWSRRADRKFDRILEYLQENWGEKTTRAFVLKVYDFLDILKEYPLIGSIENKNEEVRGFTIVRQVNVFYKIKENKVIILDFFDNRLSPSKKRY